MELHSKLRVAIVAHSKSGIAHYSYSLARALSSQAEARCDYTLVVNKAFECEDAEHLKVVKLFSKTRRLSIDLVVFLWFVFSQHMDIIHFQNPLKYPALTWWLTFLFRLFRKKVVYTSHDVLPHYAKFYHVFLMRKIYESVDNVIVHSNSNYNELLSIAPNVKAVEVVPHGIYDIFCTEKNLTMHGAREKLGLPSEAKVMLFFGRIDERKGAAALVSELPAMLKKDPELYILMAGAVKFPKGYLESLAGKAIHALTIIDDWIADDEVATYFTATDVVVLPYLEGSTSGVIKIAMAFHKPVVATRVGELAEMVKNYHAGLLVNFPLTDTDIDKLSTFVSKWKNYIGSGSYEIGGNYEWATIAAKTEKIYTLLLENR